MTTRQLLLEDVFDAIAPLTDPYWNDLRIRIAAELDSSAPKRQPLSEDDIVKLWGERFSGESEMLRNFARAIEKAHNIN